MARREGHISDPQILLPQTHHSLGGVSLSAMSRKARATIDDRSSWKSPTIYAFQGDYGPWKFRTTTANNNNNNKKSGGAVVDEPIRNALVIFYHKADSNHGSRHSMYSMAADVQELLLQRRHYRDVNGTHSDPVTDIPLFDSIFVIDVRPMYETPKELDEAMKKETTIFHDEKGSVKQTAAEAAFAGAGGVFALQKGGSCLWSQERPNEHHRHRQQPQGGSCTKCLFLPLAVTSSIATQFCQSLFESRSTINRSFLLFVLFPPTLAPTRPVHPTTPPNPDADDKYAESLSHL